MPSLASRSPGGLPSLASHSPGGLPSLTRHFIDCLFFGLFFLWPYQTFVQTQSFLTAEFPDRASSVGLMMMMCSTFPQVVMHALLSVSGLSRRLSYFAKIAAPSLVVVAISIYLLVAVLLAFTFERIVKHPVFLLNSLYISALLQSIVVSFVEPAVFDLAGLFPSSSPSQMVQAGNGACGLLVYLVQVCMRLVMHGFGPASTTQHEVGFLRGLGSKAFQSRSLPARRVPPRRVPSRREPS